MTPVKRLIKPQRVTTLRLRNTGLDANPSSSLGSTSSGARLPGANSYLTVSPLPHAHFCPSSLRGICILNSDALFDLKP